MDVLHPRDVPRELDGPVAVDLDAPSTEKELRAAEESVRASDWPSIGVRRQPTAQPHAWERALTTTVTESRGGAVVVPDATAAAASLWDAATTHVSASRTLVQVLRLGQHLEVPDALVLESLAYSALLGGADFAAWRAARPVREVPAAAGPAVLLERSGDELTVTLARKARRNSFSAEVRDALVEALEVARLDPDVHVHLRGQGPSFSSGGDLDEFGTATDLAAAHLVRVSQSPALRLHELRDRVTAHLHGACVGAGIEVPSFAGQVVATSDAWFQLPELRMGLVPGAGGTVGVTRRIGPQRTAWMVLSGERVDATTALAWGLVDEIRC